MLSDRRGAQVDGLRKHIGLAIARSQAQWLFARLSFDVLLRAHRDAWATRHQARHA